MSKKKKGYSKHHVIPKHAGGSGLDHNGMLLKNAIHSRVHKLDDMVDDKLVKKDDWYYLTIIGAAYKTMGR